MPDPIRFSDRSVSAGARAARRAGQRGFSILEVMIAAMLLILVFFGLTAAFTRGRTQIDYEEDRRKATAVAQARLDGIRRDYKYETLSVLNGADTTIAADNRTYTISHVVRAADPESQATTIQITVSWTARVGDHDVTRRHETTTILARGMP